MQLTGSTQTHRSSSPPTKKTHLSAAWQKTDKPVLDTTRIKVLVTQRSCIYPFCLYIHLNTQSGVKASQTGLIVIQDAWTGLCGLLEILMCDTKIGGYHLIEPRWYPFIFGEACNLWLSSMYWIVHKLQCLCDLKTWMHLCLFAILLKSVSLMLLNHFGIFQKKKKIVGFFFLYIFHKMKCFWLFFLSVYSGKLLKWCECVNLNDNIWMWKVKRHSFKCRNCIENVVIG